MSGKAQSLGTRKYGLVDSEGNAAAIRYLMLVWPGLD